MTKTRCLSLSAPIAWAILSPRRTSPGRRMARRSAPARRWITPVGTSAEASRTPFRGPGWPSTSSR